MRFLITCAQSVYSIIFKDCKLPHWYGVSLRGLKKYSHVLCVCVMCYVNVFVLCVFVSSSVLRAHTPMLGGQTNYLAKKTSFSRSVCPFPQIVRRSCTAFLRT